MPAKRAASSTAVAKKKTPCDNHPDREAAHTTGTAIHSPISLCTMCLRRAPHMADR